MSWNLSFTAKDKEVAKAVITKADEAGSIPHQIAVGAIEQLSLYPADKPIAVESNGHVDMVYGAGETKIRTTQIFLE